MLTLIPGANDKLKLGHSGNLIEKQRRYTHNNHPSHYRHLYHQQQHKHNHHTQALLSTTTYRETTASNYIQATITTRTLDTPKQ